MLSKWETGRHRPSPYYQDLLCRYFQLPAAALFPEHPPDHALDPVAPQLVVTHRDLQQAMLGLVDGAHEHLVSVGSRSRDRGYLDAIEHTLATRPELVHYRVLFGPPRHPLLTEHLHRLIALRDPGDRSHGVKTLHISMITSPDYPERHFVATEHAAVVTLPSLTSAEAFDTGIVLDAAAGARYLEHARQLYLAGRRADTVPALTALTALTASTSRPQEAPITTVDMLAAARDDHHSVLALTRELIAIPSRGGIDPGQPILDHTTAWLTSRRLPVRILRDPTGTAVALVTDIHGRHRGPRWVLDACLDTAAFGDEHAWTHPPTTPAIHAGWLYGRGSADSKAAVAIFCHLAARIAAIRDQLTGTLTLLFDLDEHTGGFHGAQAFLADAGEVAGVMIGYPGLDHIVVGGRGVHRARLHVHGVASHSGGRTSTPNAISKATQLVTALDATELPGAGHGFPAAKLTVTEIHAGASFSITPDLCSIGIDLRTTPAFDDHAAEQLLRRVTDTIDRAWPGTQPTLIEQVLRWPPYALPDSPPAVALFTAARGLGLDVTAKIAGPSNIGNLLAGHGIAVTAGFGVAHIGEHSTDERIRLDSIPLVHAAYHHAICTLLSATEAHTPTWALHH
ncbi:M20 family metallopeptidase [Nocardia sp. alder85J]|uniref:M20 family metallopeptidase n=1 Tax=Nocardia sp. alder85J TaxID=2862949 RepID=UPI001CD4C8B8|nr:M20/M25/M40 family metallo-hydrolase [Nocardia sp. alder85J]MCX4095684.1 M20/M25/M40 family metallo-hydrolase [Nocardia sp. alder85J]